MSTKMERLEEKAADLATENDHLASLCKAKDNSADFHRRELARYGSMFMQLYESNRTLELRYGWLEEAARDVATACADHVHDAIGRLADELGLEITEDQD